MLNTKNEVQENKITRQSVVIYLLSDFQVLN